MIASLVGTYAGFVQSLESWKIEIKARKKWQKVLGISFKLQQVLYKFFSWFGQILFNLARMFAAQHEKSFVPCVF